MSVGDHEREEEAPAPGEEVHLPGSSAIPFVCAIGITLIVIGTTINWMFSVLGAVIFIVTAVRWIQDTRRDVDALPEDHR